MWQILQRRKSVFFVAILFFNIALLLFFIHFYFDDTDIRFDAEAIAGTAQTFTEFTALFQKLSEEKGAVYAFSVLKETEFPPNIDLHLLGHIVGDELYIQEKMNGMQYCTHDFRNACSHTIVIGALLEKGPEALKEVHDACRKAPGGSGAYTMCFHGFGHGVLAYNEYELPLAVKMCEKVGTESYNNREFTECVGGAIMEMASGVHDPDVWKEKFPKYMKYDDPLYACMAPFMPIEARERCLSYLTPFIWKATGGDESNPTEDDLREAFRVCDSIPHINESDRKACFSGFGKEFVGLVLGRDIRDVGILEDHDYETIIRMCALTPDLLGQSACLESALQSLYWGGENDRSIAVAFCHSMADSLQQQECFNSLINSVQFYVFGKTYRGEFCEELPSEYMSECKETLLD